MPIDYSKWDSLVLSDSGEEGEAVGGVQDSGHSPPTMAVVVPDRIQELAVEETRELRAFLCTHPCPSKAAVTAWALKVFGASPIGETGRRLRCTLQECAGRLQDFDYGAFQRSGKPAANRTRTRPTVRLARL